MGRTRSDEDNTPDVAGAKEHQSSPPYPATWRPRFRRGGRLAGSPRI